MLASCSNDIEPAGGESGTPQPLRVSAAIGQPQSRVSGTDWNENDEIGIYCNDLTNPSMVPYANMRYITTDGSGNFTHVGGEESGIFIKSTLGYAITAIYPFAGDEGDENTIRAISTADQSRTDLDILWATGIAKNPNPEIKLDFNHVMSRLILNVQAGSGISVEALQQGKFTIDNVILNTKFDISDGYHEFDRESTGTLEVNKAFCFTEGNTVSYDMILVPCAFDEGATFRAEIGGITYKLALDAEKFPLAFGTQNTLTVTVNASGMSLSTCTIEPWGSSEHSGEAAVIPTPIGDKVKEDAAVGDYYFSDGSFADKNAELTTEQAKACIGIVFFRNRHNDDGSDYSDSGINQQKCNGYVVALTDVGNLRWSTEDFNETGVSTSDKDWNGYANQKILEERGINKYPAAKGCKDYGTGSGSKFAAPTGSSGWFLPSAGQLKHLYDNKDNISGQMDKCRNWSEESNIGWFSTDWYYWSSSENSEYSAWDVNFEYGGTGTNRKYRTDAVRAVLAF